MEGQSEWLLEEDRPKVTTPSRIKVEVAKLIERIESKRAEALAAYDQKKAEAEAEKNAWDDAVSQALKDVLYDDEVRSTLATGTDSKGTYVKLRIATPQPKKPSLSTEQFDRDIALLRMSADAVVVLSYDSDLGRRYL